MAWTKCIAALAVVVPLGLAGAQSDLNSLIEGVSVITLASDSDSGEKEQGSGVIVDGPGGLVLCTYHQVKGLPDIKVITESPRNEYSTVIVDYDADRDLALLKTEGSLVKAAVLGNADALSKLDDVVAVTTPFGIEFQYTKGSVTQVDGTHDGHPVFTVDLTADAGSSGGPVFNKSGKIVGIITRNFDDQRRLFIAASINSAYPMLRDAGISIPSDEPSNVQIIPSRDATDDDLAAIEHFNRGLRADSNDIKVEQYGLAVERADDFFEAWFNYGIALTEAEQFDQAIAAYEIARQLRPESPSVYRNLGLLYLNPPIEDYGSAEELFRKLVKYRRRSPSSHNFLGESLRKQDKLGAAEISFKNALGLDTNYANAYFNLAYTYLQMGKPDLAREYFERHQKFSPNAEEKEKFEAAIQELTH